MKILLVEDDTALRGALKKLLQREGYDVVKAPNVQSARESMDSGIDLVMLDVGLPDGNLDSVELISCAGKQFAEAISDMLTGLSLISANSS